MIDPEPTRRWYCLTPDRLVVALLAVEGFLLLSERCRWFAFNQHKGWTVLIVVATVGLTLLLMLLWFAAALLFRWRFQYSLRSLLIFVTVFAVACSWFTVKMNQAKRQREFRNLLAGMGYQSQFDFDGEIMEVSYHPRNRPYPEWLEDLLGMDFLYDVTAIGRPIEFLPPRNKLSDVEMERMKDLSKLRDLEIANSMVTDVGLESLQGLAQLRFLRLSHTGITDRGLESLKNMNDLEVLCLQETQVSDLEICHLLHMRKLRILDLTGTKITDAGMELVSRLTKLEYLELSNTRITDKGFKKVQRALPNCKISR
jgi:hypothetical protein